MGMALPPPPDQPPPTPRTDLRSHGFKDNEINKYKQVFNLLDGDGDGFLTAEDLRGARGGITEEDASWLLKQFAPPSAEHVDRIDLATFARTCEKNRRGQWSSGFAFARKELLRALSESDEPLEEILAEAGIEITPAEATEMLRVLENEASFLRAMGVNTAASKPSPRANSPLAVHQNSHNMASVLAAINGSAAPTGAGSVSSSSAKPVSDLPFFDGTGDPRDLPAAGPSLAESKYPPPTPPPLPES
ncbi:Hypothetical Protein FCC1311_044662 [Hondaea fermentalgiana]|uniref:EF-hand domain-containing protein n=1 Tax=Hondaea fermentalgiana TaxID=2315210 RepID=A0A2R5GHW1_9STRA|nr:Hypothetical Protein FCC1311_044662 [Hondaea fermentalgiana]|eukprot:GBG28243.1 Hypothetical Protein FCC1311_044662 [Hondaea fermentalgiana]